MNQKTKKTDEERIVFLSLEDEIGLRLDLFLLKKLSDLGFTRSRIQNLISNSSVLVNDLVISKNSYKILKESEKIELILKSINSKINHNSDDFLAKNFEDFSKMIHFENQDFLIINKPSSILSQPKPTKLYNEGDESEFNEKIESVSELAKNYIGKKYGFNESNDESNWQEGREFLVHRLDLETSGLMILPKTIDSYDFFKNEFSERRIKKIYKGIIWGEPRPAIHRLEHQVKRDSMNRTKMMIVTNPKVLNKKNDFEKKQTKTAITNYRIIKNLFNGAMSFVEFEIETGRTHQIRLQMSFFGFPVVFDRVYGGELNQKKHLIYKNNDDARANKILDFLSNVKNKRHLLHSNYISFDVQDEFHEFSTFEDFSEEINSLLEFENQLNYIK